MLAVTSLNKNNSDFVVKSALEGPSLGDSASDGLRFSGWIVSRGEPDDYTLEVWREGKLIMEARPLVDRSDVQKKLSLKVRDGNSFKGFDFSLSGIESGDFIEVYVAKASLKELWLTLSVARIQAGLADSLIDFLIEDEELSCKKRLAGGAAVDLALSQFRRLTKREFDANFEFYTKEVGLNGDLLGLLEKKFFLRTLIESSNKGPSSNGICLEGFEGVRLLNSFFSKSVNFLVFKFCDGYFYIGQFLHTVDFVVFPKQRVVYTPMHCRYRREHVRELFLFSIFQRKKFSLSRSASSSSFFSLLVNGTSPYHYFYDSINNFFLPNGLVLGKVFALNGQVYFPLDSFVKSPFVENAITIKDFESLQSDDQIYSVVGYPTKALSLEELRSINDFIVGEVDCYPDSPRVLSALKSIQGCNLFLWIGISSQKRAWLNQCDVLVGLLDEIVEEYGVVSCVLDGMTSSVYGERNWNPDFEKDKQLVNDLVEKLDPRVSVVDTVGFSSLEKLKVARHVDFYVANYSTGSMYPSRFYQKPGVSHLSNKMMSVVKDLHVHFNNFCVPSHLVRDVSDPENSRVDFVSYEIEKDAFIKYVLKVLSESLT